MIIFFLVIFAGRLAAAAAADPYHISINCGGDARPGRYWLREGSSTVSTGLITARISRSQFSYSLKLSSGPKIIRLHFQPPSYIGFERSNDLFSVVAGNSSLLANFSASVAARALAVNVVVKQFCVTVEENETLNLDFSPDWGNSYAFVNEIEIISIPFTTPRYCGGVVAPKPIIHVDNSTALESVHYQHVKWGPASSGDDIASMFGMWSKQPSVGEDSKMGTNKTWTVSIDTRFKYLVRLHLCEAGLHMDFVLLINGRVALTSADMHQQRRGNRELFWYNNYMVVDEELKQGDISISLHSRHKFLDRHGPLEGFEVFKIISHQSASLLTLLHSLAYSILFYICCIIFIVYLEHKLSQYKSTREDNKPLARAKQLSHRFSLARILRICGYSGDGKGFVDYGREIVVIKPLKKDSNLRENKFRNVIEALWCLRHVSLIGHCREQGVADHLYKLARKSNNFFPQSWKQRLQICVEVVQAIEYLHTAPMVIHHDPKPENILLDDKFVARLADFGSLGYASPDFISSGEGTKHSDIYSFGALVLEVLCGRAGRELRTKVEDVDYDKIDFGNHVEVELGVLVNSLTGSQKQQMPPGFEFYPTDAELAVSFAEMKIATRNFECYSLPVMGGGLSRRFWRFIYFESDQRIREWQLFIRRLSHPNLLKLLGYRFDDNEMLLVYKYMSKGSLEDHLFQSRRVTCCAGTNIQSKKVRNSCWYSVHGEGGFGTVYKGWIHEKSSAKEGSGIPVAVKKSNHQCAQGFREGQSVIFLGRHPNLVKLLGYCWEDNKQLLVYEYMIKGSFENHPFESYGQPLLGHSSMKMLIGASHGLQNLHSSDTKVIYRDFKSSKILLDKSYNAKISDFGLATTGPFADKTPVSARIMGTFGYTAPEYIMTGHVNVKSDVYGFGVLLLEVLTGLQAIDQRRGGEQQNLVVCMLPPLPNLRKIINSWLLMIFGANRAMHAVEVPVIGRDFKASNILLDDVKLGVPMDFSTGSHQWQIDRCSIDTAVIEQPSITAAPTPAKKQVQEVQQTELNKAHVPAQAPAHSDWSKQKRDVEIEVEWSGVEIINNILLSIV